jgi:pilus assembly protein CpaF
MINTVLIVVTVVAIIVGLVILYTRTRKESAVIFNTVELTFDKLLETVKNELSDLVKEDTFTGSTEAEFNSLLRRKTRISNALRDSISGLDSAKDIVIDLIYNVVTKHLPTEEDILSVVEFNSEFLDPHIKFEVLMYKYKKKHGRKALPVFLDTYGLAQSKFVIEDKSRASYVITTEDIYEIYEKENPQLDYVDMAKIMSVLVFQKYKGFGCIDTIREMDVNGVNIGASGSILTHLRAQRHVAHNSIWIYYKGKYIHFRFLNMGSEEETRRIVQLVCRYNNPGPLTEKRGFIVNTMYDKSRVLALCPPLSEYWACFVRKFEVTPLTLHQLIHKDYITNWELAEGMIRFLMRGQVTTAFTGRQGSGKTTMMAAAVADIDPRYTLRIIEMAPELYLREMYPERNILSLQETPTISASMAQDALKKSDAAVSLVGEVATDDVAMRMIQLAQVASLFTMFSHHANTPEDLVYAIRNSVANAGGITNIKTAEQQVIDVLKVDVHPDFTPDGKRFVARVSEIVKLNESVPYPDVSRKDLDFSRAVLDREYYSRMTDRETFTTRRLIYYDMATDTYVADELPSEGLIKYMLSVMPVEYQDSFKDFIRTQWAHKL